MKLLVSACLLGVPCRYDGKSKPDTAVLSLRERHTLVPVCPECLGGLPTLRIPSERRGDRVVTQSGSDVTDAYRRGAEQTLRMASACDAAILKERSPACGSRQIYDGSFSHRLLAGRGTAAELLLAAGLRVFSEEDVRGGVFAQWERER